MPLPPQAQQSGAVSESVPVLQVPAPLSVPGAVSASTPMLQVPPALGPSADSASVPVLQVPPAPAPSAVSASVPVLQVPPAPAPSVVSASTPVLQVATRVLPQPPPPPSAVSASMPVLQVAGRVLPQPAPAPAPSAVSASTPVLQVPPKPPQKVRECKKRKVEELVEVHREDERTSIQGFATDPFSATSCSKRLGQDNMCKEMRTRGEAMAVYSKKADFHVHIRYARGCMRAGTWPVVCASCVLSCVPSLLLLLPASGLMR